LVCTTNLGQHVIPFGEDDQAAVKLETSKSMEILYFSPADSISKEHYANNVLAIIADPNDPISKQKLDALFEAMHERNVIAIVRYSRNAISSPKLGIVKVNWPKGYGLFIQIPYIEDYNQNIAPRIDFLRQNDVIDSYTQVSPQKNSQKYRKRKHILDRRISSLDEANTAIDEFIDALDMSNHSEYLPKNMFNPGYQRLTENIFARAMDPLAPIITTDEYSRKLLHGPIKSDKAERLKNCFNLQSVDKKGKGIVMETVEIKEDVDLINRDEIGQAVEESKDLSIIPETGSPSRDELAPGETVTEDYLDFLFD
jgi:hypothetical protein